MFPPHLDTPKHTSIQRLAPRHTGALGKPQVFLSNVKVKNDRMIQVFKDFFIIVQNICISNCVMYEVDWSEYINVISLIRLSVLSLNWLL